MVQFKLHHYRELSGGGSLADDQAAIELNVVVRHAMGVEGLSRSLECAVRKIASQLQVRAQDAHGFAETVRIVGPKIDRSLSPDFAK